MQGDCEHTLVSAEDGRCSVALMHIQVDYERFANQAIRLQPADCDSDVIDGAESFSMARKCMMETTSDTKTDTIPQSVSGRANTAAGHQPERFHHFPRVGDFQPHYVLKTQRAVSKGVHPPAL